MNYSRIILILFFIFPIGVFAGLSFETPAIKDEIISDNQSYDFKFAFKNTGESSVEILDVKSSCACTVTSGNKAVYQPGESGEIKGTFSLGGKTGLQESALTVITNDLGQSQIKLSLQITLKKDLEFKPSLLFWRLNDELQEKTVSLTFNAGEFVSLESDNKNFTFKESLRAKGVMEVKLSPISTSTATRGVLKIKYKTGKGIEKTSTIHLLIK